MSNYAKNGQSCQNQNDAFSPIVEACTDVLKIIFEIVFKLAMWFIKTIYHYIRRRYFGIYTSDPVKLSHLNSKKQAKDCQFLGYSTNNKRKFQLKELNTSKHTAVIGSTGSGKTVCLRVLMEHALNRGMPIVYFDPKASLESVDVFKKMCTQQNKKLYLFTDIVNDASAFNPLIEGELDDISDRIINALEWSEPFYKNESIQALDDVLTCLKQSQTTITLENILTELKKHSSKKNIKGLLNQLAKVSKSQLGSPLNEEGDHSLTFNKLRMENACLYIGISAMGHSSSGNMLNKIFFGALLTHAKDALIGRVPGLSHPEGRPISIFFDELSSTIHEGFIDLQNKCRQAGMEITYATQGPSDIDRISPTLTAQIFENTNNLFIFNQIVPDHTEFFARTFGTVPTEKKTQVMQDDQKLGKGSVREVEEFMVHSNILRSLLVGQCVLLQRTPKRVDLLNIRNWSLPRLSLNPEVQETSARPVF